MKTKKVKAPSSAMRVSVGQCEFLAPEPEDEDGKVETQTLRGPIKLTASSGIPFNHPWWGRLVFDFAGMQHRDRLSLDYCHDPEQIVGYADQISTDGGQLTVAGELVACDDDDKAAELLAKGRAGVPYEASIKFDPYNDMQVEEIQAGMTATVNGRQIEGPLAIIRACRLMSVAVCPSGADPYTQAEFAHDDGREIVIQFSQEDAMPDKTETHDEITARVQSELTARLSDYCTRFGPQGQAWALSSRPLADCYADLVGQLREQYATELAAAKAGHDAALADLQTKLDAQTGAVTELTERLEAVKLGEVKPVSSTPASSLSAADAELAAKLSGRLPTGVAAFAAGLKLPK